MKKQIGMILLAAILLFSILPTAMADPLPAGAVELNAANFPDENFRAALKEEFFAPEETNPYFTAEQIGDITDLQLNNLGISDLTGIAYFTGLTILECEKNSIGTLDLTANKKLQTVFCADNGMTAINVGGCTALTTLDCSKNKLLTLDVSQSAKLKSLYVSDNAITSLNLGANTLLEDLDVSKNKLTALNVSALTKLKTLTCGSNALTSLSLLNNKALLALDCHNNSLKTLSLSANTALVNLSCGGNAISSLDLAKNTKLTLIEAADNALTSLDLAKNTALTVLMVSDNPLTSLNLSKATKLTALMIADTKLAAVDLSACKALVGVDATNAPLTSLDLSKNTKLGVLQIGGTKLTAIDLSKNTALTTLNAADAKLTALDVSKNTALTTLDVSRNVLKALDLSKNTELATLDVSGNALTSLDLSQNTKLTNAALSGQTWPETLRGSEKDSKYTFDLTKVLDKSLHDKVTFTAAGASLADGVVSFSNSETPILYTYDTGLAGKTLSVAIPVDYTTSANEIVLLGSNMPTAKTVEVDGVPYPVVEGKIALPDGMKPRVITQYSYNKTTGDVHEQYPTGMKVWFVVKENGVQTAKYYAGLDNLLQYKGSSIRIKGVKGIRMITGVPSGARDQLKNGSYQGLKLLEYGTMVAWSEGLGDKALTDATKLASNHAYKYDTAKKKATLDAVYARGGGVVSYTNVLTFDSMDKCKPDLAMRPYLKVMDASGTEYMIYGGTIRRSIGYIAYQNRNAFKSGTDAYKYIHDIIDNAYNK